MDYGQLQDDLKDVGFTTPAPFSTSTHELRYDKLEENLQFILEHGGSLFVANGNTGEYHSLTHEERVRIVEIHVEATPDDATVIGGIGGSSGYVTDAISEYEAAGVDGVMIHHPTHTYKHTRGLIEYYERIADSTDLGIVLYKRLPNVPRDVHASLTDRDNVVGVKYAVNDVDDFAQTIADSSDDVTYLNGIAERFAPSFAVEGAEGFTTGIGNFAPRESLALFDALENGEYERAKRIRNTVRPYENLRADAGNGDTLPAANNVPAIKYGMELEGLYGGPVRDPLVELHDEDKARARESYRRIKGIDV